MTLLKIFLTSIKQKLFLLFLIHWFSVILLFLLNIFEIEFY